MSAVTSDVVDGGVPERAAGRGRGRALAVALGLVVVGFVVANVLGAVPIVVELILTGELLANPVYAVASVVATMLGYAAVALVYARNRLAIPVRWPTRRGFGLAVGAVLAMLMVNIGAQAVLGALGLEAAPSDVLELTGGIPEVLLVFAVVALLVNGPAEELLFRGAVQGRLRRAFGPAAAVLLASVPFAAIHIVAVVGTLGAGLVSVGIIFLVALVLGAVYEYTDNVVVPALAHGIYNAVLFVGAYLFLIGAV
jgi:membrane protease YdiL (CAAX protease family)